MRVERKLHSKAKAKAKKKTEHILDYNFESTLNYAKMLFQALRKCLQLHQLKMTNHNFFKAGFPVVSTNEFSLFLQRLQYKRAIKKKKSSILDLSQKHAYSHDFSHTLPTLMSFTI